MRLATNAQLSYLKARVNLSARSLAVENARAPPRFDGNKEPLYECVTDATPNSKNVKCN